MRVKSDERRQAIKAAAEEVFREIGYERASMSAIAARLGGSKATLYSYFKSKEELFSAVMVEAVGEQADQMMELLRKPSADSRQTLISFGAAYLDLVLSDAAIATLRNGMMEASRQSLGPMIYAQGPGYGWGLISERLEQWHEEGRLHCPDPMLAAMHLKGLLEAGLVEPQAFGVSHAVDRAKAPAAAVDVFLSFYGKGAGGR